MKPYKSKLPYKTYVRHLVSNLKDYMLIQDWQFTLEFTEANPTGDRSNAIACVYNDTTYLNSVIELYPSAKKAWVEEPVEVFAQYVLHELVHVQTDAVYQFAKAGASDMTQPHLTAMLEQQTQRLTRIIFQSLPKSVYQL